ncbi:MAG: TIGR04086 family membrane protein [Clostridia bacterium]|nr:TIGR04086 family membrane protein [Clostridia bacterium]
MQNETATGNAFFQILKGAAFALGFSLLAVIIFANILRFTPLPDRVICPVNQTVKVVAILLGALIFVRGEKGFLKGGAIGLIFTALSYLAFSAIGGNFSLSWLIFAELALAVFAGVVGGAIAVNLRRGG